MVVRVRARAFCDGIPSWKLVSVVMVLSPWADDGIDGDDYYLAAVLDLLFSLFFLCFFGIGSSAFCDHEGNLLLLFLFLLLLFL